MKKSFFALLISFLCFSSFALDYQTDVYFSGFYDKAISSGIAEYNIVNGYDYINTDGPYVANYNSWGGSLGYDFFVNDIPVGVYLRAGLLSVLGVTRTAAGKTVNLENTEFTYNVVLDLGVTYNYSLNQYFSLCVAPAFSMLMLDSQYRDLSNYYYSRVTIDQFLAFGGTLDLYGKLRYKYFTAAAGCACSFYPFNMINAADTAIDFSLDIRKTKAYNIRPYISIGLSLIERMAYDIRPAN